MRMLASKLADGWLDAGGRNPISREASSDDEDLMLLGDPSPASTEPERKLDQRVESFVRDLFHDALENGLDHIPEIALTSKFPSAGSTAEVVIKCTLALEFFAKVDSNPKVAAEATKMRAIRERTDVPKDFRACFPHIYAVRTEGPLHGYVMQSFTGYVGLQHLCFESDVEADVRRVGDRTLDLLLSAYRLSRTNLLIPNLHEIYIERIEKRLASASRQDVGIAALLKHGGIINGVVYAPYTKYLEVIQGELASWTPAFSTFVHGDVHPENILAKVEDGGVDVKFIDPKEWLLADYIFDIGKFLHYLEVTGPAERVRDRPTATLHADARTLQYSLARTSAVERLISDTRGRIASFAASMGDRSWQKRLSLSMASNLLGLPAGRLEKGRTSSAYITLGEGLRYLSQAAGEIAART